MAGDAALAAVAGCVREVAGHGGGLAARHGGEEFAVLLPGIDLPEALTAADRLRRAVAALALLHPGSPHGVLTLSIGVAHGAPAPGQDPGVLFAEANAALSLAKAASRNCVRSHVGVPATADVPLPVG